MTERTGAFRAGLRKLPIARRSSLDASQARLEALARELSDLRTWFDELAIAHHDLAQLAGPDAEFLRFASPGHFYSPIPSLDEVESRRERIWPAPSIDLPGVDMCRDLQLSFIEALAPLHDDFDFPKEKAPGRRYFEANGAFGHHDALVLHAMLRRFEPRRIIEVGSGYSSCMILDTVEGHLPPPVDVTFVEPHDELLRSLLHEGDAGRVEILDQPVQDVDLARFERLERDDVLFIDSSHVAKVGSDVNWDVFEVLPRLQPGVVVQFHDVFHPFDYPVEWVREGRAWTEAYLLHAFLMFNDSFEILFFSHYLEVTAQDRLEEMMSRLVPRAGGSLWLRRR